MAEFIQCQSSQNSKEIIVDNIVKKKAKGLERKDYTKHYRMVKGKMAETLIKQLFESQGYKVFSSGVENCRYPKN